MCVFDGGAVASHVDGIENGQGATDAEDEAKEDTDERAGDEVHDEAMVCPWFAAAGERRVDQASWLAMAGSGKTSCEVGCAGWWRKVR